MPTLLIKKIGTLARTDIVKFLGNKVYLELFVKVEEDWRNKKSQLKEFGQKKILKPNLKIKITK